MEDLSSTYDEAKLTLQGWFDTYPGVRAYFQRLKADCRRDGCALPGTRTIGVGFDTVEAHWRLSRSLLWTASSERSAAGGAIWRRSGRMSHASAPRPVSYTHLTLPTICSV
eukprot:2768773-Prymnesium_polylepis.3